MTNCEQTIANVAFENASKFTWERAAKLTLDVIEREAAKVKRSS